MTEPSRLADPDDPKSFRFGDFEADLASTVDDVGRSRLPLLLAGMVVAIGTVVAVALLWPRPGAIPASPPPGKTMLAVLPFLNLDGKPEQEFLGDGLTEEMIAQLGRLQPEQLGVIARISAMTYKGTDKTVTLIEEELGVDYLLEGSVRGENGRVRVTAQLIQVSDQTHLWAETYDREFTDILEIQGEIASRIASSLALELLPDQPGVLARASTPVTAAYEEYLRGRYEWSRFSEDGYQRAVGHFTRALEADPEYSRAWAGLADSYNLLAFTSSYTPYDAFSKAREAAQQALQIDPDLAEAHNSLGFVRLYLDYDLHGADESFRKATRLDPNYAMAYHWHAGALAALGRQAEAIEAVRRSLELDPVSLSLISDLGWYYIFDDRWDEAIEECNRTIEMQPGYGWAMTCLQVAYANKGMHDEARRIVVDQMRANGAPADHIARVTKADPRDALKIATRLDLDRQQADVGEGGGHPLSLAFAFAGVDDNEQAIAWLERAYEDRDSWMIFIEVDPRLDSLHGDPAFEALARRVGL